MPFSSSVLRRMRLLLLAVLLTAASTASFAQCALCYSSAKAGGKKFVQGLKSGILVLIVPPMFMSVGFAVFAYKKRNRYNDDEERDRLDNEW